MPVFMSKSQVALSWSLSVTASPLSASPAFALPALTASAQATCAEPGPWQASHETFSSDQVVA